MKKNKKKLFITLKQAMSVAKCSRCQIKKLIRSGCIRTVIKRGNLLLHRADIFSEIPESFTELLIRTKRRRNLPGELAAWHSGVIF